MLARSLSIVFSVSLIAGCSAGGPTQEDVDAAPIRVKTPPSPKQGTGSSPGCMGVPARGECDDGVATYCDIGADEIRRQDCGALGKECVIDAVRGATCQAEEAGQTCSTGLDYNGLCDGNVAVWCDTESGATVRWDCSTQDMTCGEDVCADGAYCCGDDPPPMGNTCGDLDYQGICDGNVARWCQDGQAVQHTCAEGESCQIDTCADGAYCCPIMEEPASECEMLGNPGECQGDTARWCDFEGNVVEIDCAADGNTCQFDGCQAGIAACCAPMEMPKSCDEIGTAGECVGDTLRYCDPDGTLHEQDCTESSRVCGVGTCFEGLAACCDP